MSKMYSETFKNVVIKMCEAGKILILYILNKVKHPDHQTDDYIQSFGWQSHCIV